MKLNLESGASANLIHRHEAGRVRIDGQWYDRPLLVRPDKLLFPWDAPPLEALDAQRLAGDSGAARILILGTGPAQRFPAPRLMAELSGLGIGLEVMDSAAASRTYNVLAGEGRDVAAAIYLGPPA